MIEQSSPNLGVLISNLGTPEAPTQEAVKKYLAQFLSDRYVVQIPRPIWWLLLNGIILKTRPKNRPSSIKKYGPSKVLPLKKWQ
jgi:ferrochelatase